MEINKEHIIILLNKIWARFGSKDFAINKKTQATDLFDKPKFFENRSYIHNKLDYVFYKLDKDISDYLISLWYNISHQVISEPKISWPDLVIDCKSIYESNKSLSFGDFIKKLGEDIRWFKNNKIKDIVNQWVFINIYLSWDYISEVIEEVLEYNDSFGNIDMWYLHQKWIVEYSSPNIAKSMSMGHFRNTIIWQFFSNLVETVGVDTLRRNYLGDRGTPFGKFIFSLYHKHIQDSSIIDQILLDPTVVMWKIYTDYKDIDIVDKDDKARVIFSLLEKWDSEISELWQIVRELTLKDFEQTYKKLNINFDTYLWESFSTTLAWDIVEELKDTWYLIYSDGAYIIKFKKIEDGLKFRPLKASEESQFDPDIDQVLVISKSNDDTLYATRDLAMCKWRSQVLWADKMIYVVWSEQRVYFEQIISLATYMGYIRKDQMIHLGYGLYMQDGKKMSTRKGTVFRTIELIQEINDKIWTIFESRIDEDTSEKLAISTLIFNDTKWDILNDVNFDLDAITKLNGDNGIYIQYTYTRLLSLLQKLKSALKADDKNISINKDRFDYIDIEKDIIFKLSLLPNKIIHCVQNYKTHILAQYILDIAWLSNRWYSETPKIIDLWEEDMRSKYLFLNSVITVFEKIFTIFWFEKIDKM